jgi:hypothetical protein
MVHVARAALTAAALVLIAGCSQWESGTHGVTYTFTNHCGEDLVVEALGSGATITVPAGELASLRTFAQEPDEAFVVTRTDGGDGVQVAPGTSTVAIEGDICPSDH